MEITIPPLRPQRQPQNRECRESPRANFKKLIENSLHVENVENNIESLLEMLLTSEFSAYLKQNGDNHTSIMATTTTSNKSSLHPLNKNRHSVFGLISKNA